MSYILKALRKSEKERQAKQPESVTERILISQQPGKKRRTAFWIGVILLSNLFLIGSFYWFSQLTPDPSATLEPSKATSDTARDQTVKNSPAVLSKPPEPFAQRRQKANASIVEQIAARRRRENQNQSQAAEAPSPAAPSVSNLSAKTKITQDDKNEQPAAPPAQQPTQAGIEPDVEVDDEEMLDESAPVADNLQDKKIPYLDELPYQVRQTIPKMTVNAFIYSPDPSERFVVINMEKYKKGQKTKDAVVLKEILRGSVVVSYQNQTFQLARP